MFPTPQFPDPTSPPTMRPVSPHPVGPVEALASLRAGNFRYTLGSAGPGRGTGGDNLRPYAVVVGCLDARVPVETVFDQRAGQICVVRSAGHVLDRAVLGSVEFAVTELKVPLVVVLGHEDCRAIAATIEAVRSGRRPAGLRGFLIDEIAPAVADAGTGARPARAGRDRAGRDRAGRDRAGPVGADLDRITRAHVRRSVDRLKQTGGVAQLYAAHRVDVVGAVYRLDNGHVDLP